MKVELKFTFDLPEESDDFDIVCNAHKMQSVLYELDQAMRNIVKYDESHSEEYVTGVEEMRDKLYELCNVESVKIR